VHQIAGAQIRNIALYNRDSQFFKLVTGFIPLSPVSENFTGGIFIF